MPGTCPCATTVIIRNLYRDKCVAGENPEHIYYREI